MAAATVDIDINEGDTFIMALEFWANQDNTEPIDVSNDTFTGSFLIGDKQIPMAITHLSDNVIEAKVDYSLMHDLQLRGRYDIDQLSDGNNYRLIQGNVRVSPEVTV